MAEPIVVTSTTQLVAVRPRNGKTKDTAIVNNRAFLGTPLAFRLPKAFGINPSLDKEYSRRLTVI